MQLLMHLMEEAPKKGKTAAGGVAPGFVVTSRDRGAVADGTGLHKPLDRSRLLISVSTVKKHVRNVISTLSISERT